MIIYLDEPLLTRSSSLPESHNAAGRHCFLFGLASSGVYQAIKVTLDAGELLPHRFTLTTQATEKSVAPFGGMLSVALSLTFRSVGVTDHPALRSPDFPLAINRQRSPDQRS